MLTLTTDFGTKAPYVAEMKGSIYQINPNIDIVDVTHEVSRHNIFEASFVMNEVKKWFPTSVHVCVVDPGVGSGRNALIVKDGEQYFVGPDNGVFSLFDPDKIYEVNEKDLKKILGREISHTFHGRDVFAPVGAFLEIGYDPNKFSSPTDQFKKLDLKPEKDGKKIQAKVIFVDDFGNIITNIKEFDEPSEIIFKPEEGEERKLRFMKTYSDVDVSGLMSLRGSHGFLEISINQGNASKVLDVNTGDDVIVEFL